VSFEGEGDGGPTGQTGSVSEGYTGLTALRRKQCHVYWRWFTLRFVWQPTKSFSDFTAIPV
jgi:hypothetical protein